MEQNRTVRPPPRRNLFHGTRRGNPTAVRPDTAQQPTGEELVERAPNGEYSLYAPQTVYKHMALGLNAGRETDEEAEQENQMIDLYGRKIAHYDEKVVEAEVKAALKSSLAKKVASLEDDKWMFQGDIDTSGKN